MSVRSLHIEIELSIIDKVWEMEKHQLGYSITINNIFYSTF